MSAELLSLIAGVVLSLVFSYVPGLEGWFDKLEPNYKRLVMIGSLLVVALAVFGLSCANWYNLVSCDVAGAKTLVEIFILAAMANQTAYKLSPRKAA